MILEMVLVHQDKGGRLSRDRLVGTISRHVARTWEVVQDDVRAMIAAGDLAIEWGWVRITPQGRQLLKDLLGVTK